VPISVPSPTEQASSPSPKLLPAPVAHSPDVQQSIEDSVKKLLPNILKTILPDMLPLLFAIPQPSRSPSPSPSVLPPIPKPVSSLGTFITAQVAARVESQLRDIYDKTLDHAMDLRNTADGGFFDEIQDHKLDVYTLKEDSIAELLHEIDSKLVELKESTAAIVEEAGEQADNVYNDVCASLDGLLEHTKARLSSGRENIDSDTEVQPTFSPPDSRQAGTRSLRRANSLSRDSIIELASAYPPTIIQPSSGLKVPPPRRVRNVMGRLEDGLDRGWIPGELQRPIEEDQGFGYQRIERHAWGESTAHTLSGSIVDETRTELAYMLRKVKKIWLNAQICQSRGCDENAWCIDVIQPLIKLAMRLEGEEKFRLQSVYLALQLVIGTSANFRADSRKLSLLHSSPPCPTPCPTRPANLAFSTAKPISHSPSPTCHPPVSEIYTAA
jgi:hypothetical protein